MLTEKDFKHYKKLIEKDKAAHKKMMDLNRPEDIIAAYNGLFHEENLSDEGMVENFIFIAANTVVPTLFFQLPRITVKARREEMSFAGSVINSLVNCDFGDNDKKENQLCILDAFLPYGYSIMKNGYNSRTAKIKAQENKMMSLLTGQTKTDNRDNDMEGDVEYIRFEKTIGLRQDPRMTYLDSEQPFGKGNRITFEYKRTIQNLVDSNMYKLSSNFLQFFKGKGDLREVETTLTEFWIMIEGKAHKLVYVDNWEHEELGFIETKYDTLPVSYLRFNQLVSPAVAPYSISHGALAYRAQKELNYLNELWKKHIDQLRNQFLIYEKALNQSGKATLRANEIGGVVFTDQPLTAGVAMPLQSAQMDSNLFGNINDVRSYLNLVLSATGAKTGEAASDLATTEKQKQLGDTLRASGMQDNIRDFVVDQVKQRIKNYLRLASPEMVLKLTGDNLINPMTGKTIPNGSEIVIGGEKGFELSDLIAGDIDTDYIFEVDIVTAQRPDFPVVRKQLAEGITLASQLEPKLTESGKKIHYDKMLEDYFATFDAIPDAKKYISDMTEEDKMKLMAQMGAMQGMGGSVPTEEAIASGASAVPTETAGMGV